MADTRAVDWFRRADLVEHALCVQLNRGCSRPGVRNLFVAVSRLGDGLLWYILILALPVLCGRMGLLTAARMIIAGAVGVGVYKLLKHRLVRERPFISFAAIVPGTPPLDRYSFPSGHTLHAVAFTVLTVATFPPVGWFLVPFAALIAASRLVLGLHYPTDVAAGALLGAGIACGTMRLMPL